MMKLMKPFCAAVFLVVLPPATQAAIITELFEVTLPSASGPYSAGHKFQITATYDDAGTVMHAWNDGPDGVAQFGSGDDTLAATYNLATSPGYTLFSDAQITISGIAPLPSGTSPYDFHFENYRVYQEFANPASTGFWDLRYRADDLYLEMSVHSPADCGNVDGCSYFSLTQNYVDSASGATNFQGVTVITQSAEGLVTTVPEPATLALLGLGLAGLAATRRRKQ